jgi:alkylation response protein AidB-like acyl-CoA dehydrogenase
VNGSGTDTPSHLDLVTIARELGPVFAARAAAHDANDSFPHGNFQELKQHRLFAAGIPTDLGGIGASSAEQCAMLRELGRYCGATALSFSMHVHLVAGRVWLWRQEAPVGSVLERIAREQLVLCTTGARDWLDSSGSAERVDGGFRITPQKPFSSGSPGADLLVTSAILPGPD